jgi:GNAT superfamily N-acetyltransferase
MVEDITVRRITNIGSDAYAGLVSIYEDIIPGCERKDRNALEGMLLDPRYRFFVAETLNDVVGFAILCLFRRCDAAGLDYFGIRSDRQNAGIGRRLFQAISSPEVIADRALLLEVEREDESAAQQEQTLRRRRRRFYRALGCREVGGLNYQMPEVSGGKPPPMSLFVLDRRDRNNVRRDEVVSWVAALYVELYRRDAADQAIAAMTASLPSELPLS